MAAGRVFEYAPDDMCHHVLIGEDQRKVQIDFIHDHARGYDLPIPHPEFRELHEAIGSFLLWPLHLIAVDTAQVSI